MLRKSTSLSSNAMSTRFKSSESENDSPEMSEVLQKTSLLATCCPRPLQIVKHSSIESGHIKTTSGVQEKFPVLIACKSLQGRSLSVGDTPSSTALTGGVECTPQSAAASSPVSVRETARLSLSDFSKPLPLKGKRKRVQFEASPPEEHEAAVAKSCATSSDDKAILWYQRDDLNHFRKQAKRLCKKSWVTCGSDLEKIEFPSDFAIDPDQSEIDDTSWEFDEDAFRTAQQLASSPHFEICRGLEHMASSKLCLARSLTVLNAKTLLTLEQARRHNVLGECESEEDELVQNLAEVYGNASLPAAKFARIIALADEAAAAMVYSGDDAIETKHGA